MPEQFNPGDVVRLKSGGPKMTVSSVDESFGGGLKVYCDWFEGSKKLSDTFEPTSLKLAAD